MSKPASDIKPMFAFSEKDKEVTFDIIIDGMKVSRKLAKGFSKYPDNATVIDAVFEEQSMNFAINYQPTNKTYRFKVRRLPCKIHANRTKIEYATDRVTLILYKKEREPWRPYIDTDFETDHD